jgi:ATP-dependent Lhr-like helicase
MNPEEIKRRLRRTWVPFFSRFGKFTPIQELSIPHILNRENVVVISPAATGKTEAVIAPLIENVIENRDSESEFNGLKILYISPTRALVNDLYRRLIDPINYVGITLARKTGDRPQLDYRKLPGVLLTTPESFDSLLARHPPIFINLTSVVLDEIHLLDNTPRGDQLRVCLRRLRKINNKLHYCALSATIDDLDIGTRYFSNSKVCFLKSAREIESILITNKNFVPRLLEILKQRNSRKILVFFNARSLAELYSQNFNLPPFHDAVLVHHASLQKQRREDVERQMNNSDRAILCATSTLELGIDIGDVDCIVLYRPPYNISSLLQRIGRGNRKTNKLFAIGIYTDEWEKILFETFFDCAIKGRLFEKRYQPSLSVIPQQIYSYLYQRRRIGTTLKGLFNILVPVYTEGQIKTVFKKLLDDDLIKELRPGIYFDSYKLEKKIDWGKIHSNISEISFGEYDVYDIASNKLIGRIFHLKSRFILGGRCWETVQVAEKDKRVYAKYIGDTPAVAQVFEGKGAGNYNYLLAPILKDRIYPGLELDRFPVTLDRADTYILHLFGSLYGFILADGLNEEGIDAIDVEGKMLILNRYQIADNRLPIPKIDSIKKVISRKIAKLEDALGSGAYFYDLPGHYQVEDHYLNLDIDGFLEFLSSIKLVKVDLKEFQKALKGLEARLQVY